MEKIKDLPLLERPREKLLNAGTDALSNAELIAILLGSGNKKTPLMQICEQLIALIENQPHRLANMPIDQLCEIRGIGEVKAIILTAAIELGKRAIQQHGQLVTLETFGQVAAFLSPYLPRQESAGYFLVMCNNRKELLATQEIAINESGPPSVKLIMQTALTAGAFEIILCRAEFDLTGAYFDKEKAFIVQLDAAASMMNVGMRGLFIMEKANAG